MLEGERHVERSIDTTPKIWYRKEHSLPPLPTPVNSTSVVTIPVWKEVIRLTVDDRYIDIDIDIYISTRPPELEDGWVRSDVCHPLHPDPGTDFVSAKLPSQLTTPSASAEEATVFSSGTTSTPRTADISTITSCTSTHFPNGT
jgi:hypothetical protein